MSPSEQFWQYANEAFRRADRSENEKEKQALLDLARTWTQAAVASESIFQSAEHSSAPLSHLFHWR
jgi:hypothetical protein